MPAYGHMVHTPKSAAHWASAPPRPLSARWRCNAKVSRRLPHSQARPAASTGRPGQNDLAFLHHAARKGWCMLLSVLRLGAVCLLGIVLQTTACLAQAYPERVVSIVILLSAGGSVCGMSRHGEHEL